MKGKICIIIIILTSLTLKCYERSIFSVIGVNDSADIRYETKTYETKMHETKIKKILLKYIVFPKHRPNLFKIY